MRDALLKALSDRVRVFTDSGAADVVLDDAALQVAAELTAIAGEYLDTEQAVVADILHTVAAYYWARALAHRDAALAAADHREAMQIFGLLYLLDHRRVPRALWGQLTEETGHDPWRDPVNRASDLVLDAEESGDLSGLAQATALLGEAPASLYRDTMLGIALCLRAGDHDRPNADRLADAETAVELLDGVAATSEESPARRASRRLTLANAFTQRFILSGDHADLAASESAARTAFTEAPEGSTEQEDAAAAIGLSLGRCSDGEPTYQAVTLLQESVQWLRLAVDLGTASGREPRHRVNLRTAMGRLLERTNLVRKDQQDEHAEQETRDKPDKPDERAVQAPPLSPDDTRQARALLDMAEWVASRIIPEAEAVRRVVTPAFLLSRDTADAVVGAAMGLVDSGDSERALPTLILTLEAAAARWGTGPESPWWPAADAYVEAVRHSLVSRPDGVRFHRAHDIVRAQIDVLRGRSETEELAETLYAAGLLHLSPYTSDMSGLTFDSADRLRQERQDRHRALHLDDAAGHPMPSPEEAVAAAVKYLRDAAHLSSGHALERALRSLAEALSFLAGMQGKSYDQEILGAARTAFDVLDPRRDPLGRLYLLRVLNMFSEVALPRELSGLLPVPLATIRRQRGEREASAVFAEALTLTDEAHRPDLQAGLIDLADRDLPDLSSDAQRRLRWQIEVHLLAGNRLTCVVGPMRVDAVAEEIRSRADAEGWSAVERAATLVHLAAHAHPAETGNACRDLLDEARRFAPQVFERYADALHYLDAVLAHDLGVHAVESRQQESAAGYFASAAFQFGLCGQIDLALAALDAGLGCAYALEGPSASQAAHALVPASVFLRQGVDETVDWTLHNLYQVLAAKLTGATVDLSAMAAVHQAAKGMDFTIVAESPGPLRFSAILNRLLEQARRAEALLSSPLPDFDLPGGAETATLFYLGAGEAEPDGGAEAEARNQQRAADHRISSELRATRVPTRLPLLPFDEIQALLPEETVLLSLILSQARHGHPARPVLALQGMVVTRDTLAHRTMLFPDIEGELARVFKAGHTLHVSPAAIQVASLRREITADPLHRQVSRAGERLLADDSRSYLAGFTDSLSSWLTEGRSHLCIWPNGPLHYLPFSLLWADGHPIADHWTVTQVPGISFLSRPARPTTRSHRHGLAAFAFDSRGTNSLETHAARVAASMGDAEAVLGAAATPRQFRTALSDACYVHVAAHGSHNEWAPWYQCLFLAADPKNNDDGRIFAHDVLRMDLRGVELVTISACESALGRFDINDNLRGLPAAFLSAGAAAVIGCIWPVAPDVATEFFGALYARLASDPDRRRAFRTAQSATRARHPAYRDWGSFSFLGDWRSPFSSHGAIT